jgi:hypothetical protein
MTVITSPPGSKDLGGLNIELLGRRAYLVHLSLRAPKREGRPAWKAMTRGVSGKKSVGLFFFGFSFDSYIL